MFSCQSCIIISIIVIIIMIKILIHFSLMGFLFSLQGCDASVLLDDTPNMLGEKLALSNIDSLRSYEVIDEVKEELEKVCPGTVSCADIIIMASRAAVVLVINLLLLCKTSAFFCYNSSQNKIITKKVTSNLAIRRLGLVLASHLRTRPISPDILRNGSFLSNFCPLLLIQYEQNDGIIMVFTKGRFLPFFLDSFRWWLSRIVFVLEFEAYPLPFLVE